MNILNIPDQQLNAEQRIIYETIIEEIDNEENRILFIDAPGGTGKTFLLNLILAKVRSDRQIILATAASGIAATLLEGGKTAHSPLPIYHEDTPMCKIRRGSQRAELLMRCRALVWDECTMSKKQDIEAVHRTFQDIRGHQADLLFGGIFAIFSGDFRQCLPVILKSTPMDCIEACFKNSFLWQNVERFNLTRNMRILGGDTRASNAFAATLLKIGNGTLPCSDCMEINVNISLCVPISTQERLVDAVFPDVESHYSNRDWLRERAILAPLNVEVDPLNLQIQERLPRNLYTRTYYSIDTCVGVDDEINFPTEVLNNLEISNFPAHELKLRVGSPIILLRNLDPPRLCNGIRLIVKFLRNNSIIAHILTGPGAGEEIILPRIKLVSDDQLIVKFSRRQFPVRLAYATTINKAQGQTLKIAGVDLLEYPCFSHGQLYVACSRVGARANLYVAAKDSKTKNIVYPQVLT